MIITSKNQTLSQYTKIQYAHPIPCVITPLTDIKVIDRCDLSIEELKENVVLELKYSNNYRDYLIYPKKSWNKIYYRYIEPLDNGRAPKEPGLLLYGPPGTGKTSMIDSMAQFLGLKVVSIISSDVLSPYVGESEEKFKAKLDEVEAYEPSLLKLDDAEWMLMKRATLLSSGAGAMSVVGSSLLQHLLDRLPKWKYFKRKIVAIASTNVSPEVLDPALIRSGRFGREPVFIPLPNYEAIYTLMIKLGADKYIDYNKLEEYARKLTNLGANMADVRDIIDQIIEGKEPRLESKGGRGYIRPIPYKIYKAENLFRKLDKIIHPQALKSSWSRFAVLLDPSLAEAIIVQYLIYKGLPVVLLIDSRYVDEAISTAESSEAILVVNTNLIEPDVQRLIFARTKRPVIYLGESLSIPAKIILTRRVFETKSSLRKELLMLVMSYYNISLRETGDRELSYKVGISEERILEDILNKPASELLDKIKNIKHWGMNTSIKYIKEMIE